MQKKKPQQKKFTRINYHHLVVRLCLICPMAPASELKNLTGVQLVAALFECSPAKVAREIAGYHAKLKKLSGKTRTSRKAK